MPVVFWKHHFYRRTIIIVSFLLINLCLIICIAYLINQGGDYILSINDIYWNRIQANLLTLFISIMVNWKDSYIGFQNWGINLVKFHSKISWVFLPGIFLVLGIKSAVKLVKAAFHYSNNKISALVTTLFCGLLVIEVVAQSILLISGGDWLRSFWWNIICLSVLYGLNKYANHIQDQYYPLYSYSIFHRFFRDLGFLFVPIFAVILLGSGIYFSSNTITKNITIKANDGWTSTGLSLNSGESAEVTYIDGSWAVNQDISGSYLYTDVNGLFAGYRTCELDNQWFPLHNTRPGQLLARIGTSEEIIPLDKKTIIASNHAGILYLRANDSDFCLRDNSGSVAIRVNINRTDWENTIIWSIFDQIVNNLKR